MSGFGVPNGHTTFVSHHATTPGVGGTITTVSSPQPSFQLTEDSFSFGSGGAASSSFTASPSDSSVKKKIFLTAGETNVEVSKSAKYKFLEQTPIIEPSPYPNIVQEIIRDLTPHITVDAVQKLNAMSGPIRHETIDSIVEFLRRTANYLLSGAQRGWRSDDSTYEGDLSVSALEAPIPQGYNISGIGESATSFSLFGVGANPISFASSSSSSSSASSSSVSPIVYGIRPRWPRSCHLQIPPAHVPLRFSQRSIDDFYADFMLTLPAGESIRTELTSDKEKQNFQYLMTQIYFILAIGPAYGEALQIGDYHTGSIGTKELWLRINNCPIRNLWAYLGCKIDGFIMPKVKIQQSAVIIQPQQPPQSSLINHPFGAFGSSVNSSAFGGAAVSNASHSTHDMPSYRDALQKDFIETQAAMKQMNSECWYQNLDRVREVASEFILGHRQRCLIDQLHERRSIRPLQFYGRKTHTCASIPGSALSPGVSVYFVSFILRDGADRSYSILLELSHQVQYASLRSLSNGQVHSLASAGTVKFIDMKPQYHIRDLHWASDASDQYQNHNHFRWQPHIIRAHQQIIEEAGDSETLQNHLDEAFRYVQINAALNESAKLINFSHFGPSFYTENHPPAATRAFNHALIDTSMSSSGLSVLPHVILDLIGEYFSFSLPFLDDEAKLQMSKYELIDNQYSQYEGHNQNPVESIQRQDESSSFCLNSRYGVQLVSSRPHQLTSCSEYPPLACSTEFGVLTFTASSTFNSYHQPNFGAAAKPNWSPGFGVLSSSASSFGSGTQFPFGTPNSFNH